MHKRIILHNFSSYCLGFNRKPICDLNFLKQINYLAMFVDINEIVSILVFGNLSCVAPIEHESASCSRRE